VHTAVRALVRTAVENVKAELEPPTREAGVGTVTETADQAVDAPPHWSPAHCAATTFLATSLAEALKRTTAVLGKEAVLPAAANAVCRAEKLLGLTTPNRSSPTPRAFDDAESLAALAAAAEELAALGAREGGARALVEAGAGDKVVPGLREIADAAAAEEEEAAGEGPLAPLRAMLASAVERTKAAIEALSGRVHPASATLESELRRIIGLPKLKQQLRALVKQALVSQMRAEALGLDAEADRFTGRPMHICFLGNPGTGKTSIAKSMGRVLKEAGLTSDERVRVVQREDLVGEHIGSAATLTKEALQKAAGGVLFVDEAYRLYSESSRDYGREALETIMAGMLEEGPKRVTVFMAGYKKDMNKLFNLNPGLRSRFASIIEFPDYSVDELCEIARVRLSEREEHGRNCAHKLSRTFPAELLFQIIDGFGSQARTKANARIVDELFAGADAAHAARVADIEPMPTREQLVTFEADDLIEGSKHLKEKLRF